MKANFLWCEAFVLTSFCSDFISRVDEFFKKISDFFSFLSGLFNDLLDSLDSGSLLLNCSDISGDV